MQYRMAITSDKGHEPMLYEAQDVVKVEVVYFGPHTFTIVNIK